MPALKKPRLALIADFTEERWPSMDLVAEMLTYHLGRDFADDFEVTLVRPGFVRIFGRSGRAQESGFRHNADRIVNRFIRYPLWLRHIRENFDLFHILDHSYSHLTHYLPPDRTIVTCHDLDAFRCLLEPSRDRRSVAYRAMARRVLSGFKAARLISCVSHFTANELLRNGLADRERIFVIPNGVHPAFDAARNCSADRAAERLLGPSSRDRIEVVHVGSTEERKRLDILLHVFAGLKRVFPAARLVRAGGSFRPEHSIPIRQLGLDDSIVVLPFLEREVLAAVYRRASVVLLTSDAEGFGLPIIEALACGSPVVASDLPVLRESGGDWVTYCRVGAIEQWIAACVDLINAGLTGAYERSERRAAGIAWSSKFKWRNFAEELVHLYRKLDNLDNDLRYPN